jgi:hypothetical protein
MEDDRPQTQDITGLLRRIACIDLPGVEPSFPTSPLTAPQFGRLLAAARANRLLGLLAVGVDDGLLEVTDAQAAAVYEEAAAAIRGDLSREALLVDASVWLSRAGIEFRVLKGPAVAHLDERDPVRRSFGDIDILIPGESFPVVLDVLAAHGFARTFPEPRPGFDGRFSKGACLRRDSEELDLHRTLAPGPFGMCLPVRELWGHPCSFELDGQGLLALPAELRLLHAAYHAILGGSSPRLVAMRDLSLIAARPDIDAQRLVDTAQRWQGTIVLRHAVAAVREAFGLDLAQVREALPDGPDPRWQRRAMRAYGSAPGRYARQAVASLAAVSGPSARLQYLRALVFPDQSYLQERDRGRLGRLGRAVRSLARRGRP